MKQARLFLVILIMLLSSCNHYVDWCKCRFIGQGASTVTSLKAADPFIHTSILYDRFQRVGCFDIIWLTEEVQEVFVNLREERLGLDSSAKQELWIAQKEKLGKELVFYVLGPISPAGPILCTPSNALHPWSIYLRNGCNTHRPIDVKTIDIEPEYLCILPPGIITYRQPYKVTFDLKDIHKDKALNIESLELVISSSCFSCSWMLPLTRSFICC